MQFSDPNTYVHVNLIQLMPRDYLSKKNSDQF